MGIHYTILKYGCIFDVHNEVIQKYVKNSINTCT